MTTPTETQVLPGAKLLAVLTALTGVGGILNGAILSLFKAPVVPDHDTVLADYVVADFDGYADSGALTWTAPYYDVDGTALVAGTNEVFISTGSVTPNTIYGYILATAARAALIAGYVFQTPVGINRAGDAVDVTPFFRYSGI